MKWDFKLTLYIKMNSKCSRGLNIPLVSAKSLQLCTTFCYPRDCSPPCFSVHGILQARILEGLAISSSRESSCPRDQTFISCISCIAGGVFTALSLQGSPHKATHPLVTGAQLEPATF